LNGRTLLIITGLLALAAGAPSTAAANEGGTDRPVMGDSVGTVTFGLGAFPLPASASGTGHVSQLGNTTYSLDFTITPTGLTTFTVAGTQTLVAANGDQLFATFTGTGVADSPFAVGQRSVTTSQFTVTGGTGRFADATGTLTSVVVSEVLTIAGGFATDSQEGTITGTISY
jgi:hypothetical protein